jgi:hypothetical protein
MTWWESTTNARPGLAEVERAASWIQQSGSILGDAGERQKVPEVSSEKTLNRYRSKVRREQPSVLLHT